MSYEPSSTGKLSILLVENSRTARAVMETLLSQAGHQVATAPTGPQAIDYLENNHVDLVIMDIYMPLMNGYEVSQEIRSSDKHYANVPIIAYTSSKNPKDIALCEESGINEFITKEADNQALLSWINNYFSRL